MVKHVDIKDAEKGCQQIADYADRTGRQFISVALLTIIGYVVLILIAAICSH